MDIPTFEFEQARLADIPSDNPLPRHLRKLLPPYAEIAVLYDHGMADWGMQYAVSEGLELGEIARIEVGPPCVIEVVRNVYLDCVPWAGADRIVRLLEGGQLALSVPAPDPFHWRLLLREHRYADNLPQARFVKPYSRAHRLCAGLRLGPNNQMSAIAAYLNNLAEAAYVGWKPCVRAA